LGANRRCEHGCVSLICLRVDPEHTMPLFSSACGQREKHAKGEYIDSFHVNLIKGLTGFATFAV
jgi:hypothetical protein